MNRDGRTSGAGGLKEQLTPRRILTGLLLIIALVFVFQNTAETRIRLIGPQVTMPLWVALGAVLVIGLIVGALFMGRRRR